MNVALMERKKNGFLLFAIAVMAFLINVDYTAVNLALIPMAKVLHANLNTIQWALTAYVLSWAVLVIPAGRYADQFNKKSFCIVGLILFMLASLLAGVAHTTFLLISARILQGVAGAIYVPTLYALIYLNFDEKERGRAMGILSLGVGLGMAMGPFIGGAILSWLNWRYIFFINIPITLLAALIIYKSKEVEVLTKTSIPISKTSVLLLTMIIVGLLYLLGQWQMWSLMYEFYLILALIVATGLLGFFYLQKKLSDPLIPLRIFSNLEFSGCCMGILLEQYGFSTIIIISGIYLQKILHYSALQSSLIYLFLTIIFGVVAALSGRWIDRVGFRWPIMLGLAIMMLGSLLFTLLAQLDSFWMLGFIFMVLGFGMGLAFSGLNTGIIKTVPAEFVSIGSSLFVMLSLIGNALGITFTSMIYEKMSFIKIQSFMQSMGSLNSNQVHQLLQYISDIGDRCPNLNTFDVSLQNIIINKTVMAFSSGVSGVMLVNFIVCLLAVWFCYRWLSRT